MHALVLTRGIESARMVVGKALDASGEDEVVVIDYRGLGDLALDDASAKLLSARPVDWVDLSEIKGGRKWWLPVVVLRMITGN